jgi:hypothetical protein
MRLLCCLSVCLYVHTLIAARQRLSKHVAMATNTHATLEELFDTSLYMRCVRYQRKVVLPRTSCYIILSSALNIPCGLLSVAFSLKCFI